ncbi:5-formyltetrahydrofolate cyclo-ligase [Kaistella antarctica]|uniref:5-formyltetrahydrofolate cyclo-ligase n=1 Tax=Kaistella antarctica TaxID=266748 RepID=A0A3S4UTN1_9FLAO|nr:5-formyltetrahydrofolate cyclo-ligase [Kaistella antarctica]KEY18625.1 5-formyltetrahydrofolate cyclo-ligase [Kaistella antarctica]SEW17338.1 5-formyltetrahydrofolate cyclo-ligase [Kaistella antarctica]VEH99791.1 5-formyltetrahydrofolate cyclo-ligase family protein [Kaistella antarctica]
MNKSEIRKVYLKKKELLTEAEVQSLSEKIFENLLSQFDLKENQKVHCFLSIPEKGEVDTYSFLNYFFENKIRVFVPKIVKGKLIALEINKETPLIENSWGIKEPAGNEDCGLKDFDLIITPLLYADQFGNRVGYGKGFYDRFFSEINPNSIKVGVSFFPPFENVDDVSEFDVPLNYLVTPTEVLSFFGLESKSTK